MQTPATSPRSWTAAWTQSCGRTHGSVVEGSFDASRENGRQQPPRLVTALRPLHTQQLSCEQSHD